MVGSPIGLRRSAALLVSALLALAGLACHKGNNGVPAGQIQLDGTVTYTRIPLHFTDAGVPTGLETDPSLYTSGQPARGVQVRVFQLRPQSLNDLSMTSVWTNVATTTTDLNGYYKIQEGILQDFPTFVELTSASQQQASPASVVAIIADPEGVYSARNITERPIYVLRQDILGNPVSDPTQVASSIVDRTVNFSLGLKDPWQVVHQQWWNPAQNLLPTFENDTVPLGSRVLAILDSLYYFNLNYGNAVPTSTTSELDLHYRPGVSTRRGAFVEFNPQVFTQAYDGAIYHYFGSLQGGGVVDGTTRSDDAYDTGVLFPLFGRCHMFGERKCALIPTGVPASSLAPDLVLVEGLGDAMAAILSLSPYLPASNSANRYATVRDIRDLSGLSQAQIGPFSAPAVSALTWQLALVNAGITAPGTYASWKSLINPPNLNRFYTLLNPTMQNGTTTVNSDCVSIYTQLARLQEPRSGADSSDLAIYFQDNVLSPLCAQFNIPWSTAANAILPQYTTNWGVDPDSATVPFPSMPFTMSLAQQINRYALDANGVEQVSAYYPNNSRGEVAYAMFALTEDRTYDLSVSAVPAVPAGFTIEVVIDGDIPNAYLFPGGTNTVIPVTLAGNPRDVTTPAYHSVRIRILSPSALAPDMRLSLQLQKAS